MDSSPKSETNSNNLRRYKGIRASKKSLYSCTDFYAKSLADEKIDDNDDDTLNRSVSLTALGSELSRPQSAVEPRKTMAQLETLEARMANIEVSLSSLGPRRKRNGTTRSLHSSHLGGNSTALREFHKEIEFYKQGLKDKENLILNLQAQLRKLSKRKLVHGSVDSSDSGVVSLRILSESERKAAEERLAQLDKDMDIKRSDIKRINHRLERICDPSDNIDKRIEQAELEYDLEREELNLMNLQEERRNLHTLLDDNDAFQKRSENSLFASMPLNTQMALHSFEIVYSEKEPSFTVGKREDRSGTYITWTRDDRTPLKRGDRIVEINGTTVIAKGVNRIEEFWIDEEQQQYPGDDFGIELCSHPLRMVIMRNAPPPPPPRQPNREIHTLREELALVSAKLEQVNAEKRELQSLCQKLQKEHGFWEDENERYRLDSDKLSKERDNLRTEAVRLKHRISYLEEQVTDLLHRKEMMNGSQSVTVFQKGNHKTIVAEPIKSNQGNQVPNRPNSPSRPPSVASSRACDSRQALKTRLWETFRRATTSDSRSVCSVESHNKSSCTENGYFKKRSDSKKKLKPQPPTKPVRLSLQRATSTTNVYPTGEIPEMNPGLKRSNYSENTLLPDWKSDDMRLRSEAAEQKQKRSSKHGLRWPSLRPASSMSYNCNRSSNQIANF